MSYKTNPLSLRKLNKPPILDSTPFNFFFFKKNLILFELIKNYFQYQGIKLIQISGCVEKTFMVVWAVYYKLFITTKTLKKQKKNRFKKKLKKKPKQKKEYQLHCTRGLHKILYLQNFKIINKFNKKRNQFILGQLKNSILTLGLKKKIKKVISTVILIKLKNIKWCLKFTNRTLNKKFLSKLWQFKRRVNIKNMVFLVNLATYTKQSVILSDFLVTELCKLKRQWPLIHLAYKIISSFLQIRINIFGLKIQIRGRINGRRRKKKITKKFGTMPLQVISSNIDYGLSQGYNTFGMFSISVWIHYY